jgi:UDP-2,3-diacylglucosamine pyrophosphatase LpxH
MNKFTLIIILLVSFQNTNAQSSSIIVLGDLHYNIHSDHDTTYLKNRGLLEESLDYADNTEKYWTPFMKIIKQKALTIKPNVKAIVQVGDLSEGLAGTPEKAKQMAANTVKAIEETKMPVPWVIVKGNHETYGPGADEAYKEYFVPMFQKQMNNPNITGANYSYTTGNILIVSVNIWDTSVNITNFIKKELSTSKAKYKFVATHEPLIPVSGYCWYTFNTDSVRHNRLLEIIAKNKAIVLCGHLHYYSVLSRETKYGPVVQVMTISVITDPNYKTPSYCLDKIEPSMADSSKDWKPETVEDRRKLLEEETKYITSYKQTDLPGYAIIKMDDEKKSIQLEYYPAFGEKPYDVVSLSDLQNK